MGDTAYTFNEDGTGTILQDGKEMATFTYTQDGETLTINGQEVTVEGNSIVFETEGTMTLPTG